MFVAFKGSNVVIFIIFLFIALLTHSAPLCAQPFANALRTVPPEVGIWATKENDGAFKIYSCGQYLCGRFVGMLYTTPLPPNSKKGNSQCNFLMLRNFTPDASGKRWLGRIFDPRDEQGYDAKIWVSDKGELKVRGYLGISLFGETHTWHRYTGSILKGCLLPVLESKSH